MHERRISQRNTDAANRGRRSAAAARQVPQPWRAERAACFEEEEGGRRVSLGEAELVRDNHT